MNNKQQKRVVRRLILGLLYIILGTGILFFVELNPLRQTIGFLFLFLGGLFLIHSWLSFVRYKKTGEFKPVLDERLELNSLKASRKGFVTLISLFAALMILKAFEVIDDTVFVSLTGPVFALGLIVYFVFYFYYEKVG
jgi:uncharacterized membrane protein